MAQITSSISSGWMPRFFKSPLTACMAISELPLPSPFKMRRSLIPVREVIHFKRNVYVRALEELGVHAFPDGLPARPDWWTDD